MPGRAGWELRLVVQEPGDSLAADDFETAGALYKAQSGGSFTYRGLDPDEYDGSFRQVSGEDQADLAQLIEFIRWVEESTDEQFASGLGERLDVASLARYLVLHNLLLDFDDMTGPGQNYYLWWDSAGGQFTVVSWDLNLSWSGDPARGPFEQGAMAGPGGAAGPQGGGLVPGVGQAPSGQMPGGGAPPAGGPRPGGQTAPGGVLPSQGGPPQAGDGPVAAMGGNLLAERFLEVDEFRALYEDAYQDLYDELFAGGAALQTLDTWAATLSGAAGELIDAATLEQEVATLRELITARAGALADDPVVAG